MISVLGLKLKFAIAYLAALACGGIGGVCAHYVILPADWPLWRRILWGLIAFYAVLAGQALIGVAANNRRELRQYFHNQHQQRIAAAERWLEGEARHGRD